MEWIGMGHEGEALARRDWLSHIGTLALISERLTSSCSLPSSTTESMALDS